MERLYKGIRKFQQEKLRPDAEFYANLANGQSPDTLFFTCSDSRMDPNLITQSRPGELFIVRNIGNIVPFCNDLHKKTCTAAAIEFAINMLNISTIVLCGHSNCGAVKAMFLDDKEFSEMPNLKEWLDTASIVKENALKNTESPAYSDIITAAEKEHIKTQLEHLKSYPLILKALNEGKVSLQGWHYNIGTGAVYRYDEAKNSLEEIRCAEDGDRCSEGEPFREPCGDLG